MIKWLCLFKNHVKICSNYVNYKTNKTFSVKIIKKMPLDEKRMKINTQQDFISINSIEP